MSIWNRISERNRTGIMWGAIAALIAVVILATGPGKADSWLDFTRTLVATLTGAFVAFYFNSRLQREQRRREEKAAGNHAMQTIWRQYSGFMNARKKLREEVQRNKKIAPMMPAWLIAHPLAQFLPSDALLDFRSITFLYEDPANFEAIESIAMADALYRDFLGYLNKFTDAAIKKQEKIEASGIGDGPVTPEKVIALIGPA